VANGFWLRLRCVVPSLVKVFDVFVFNGPISNRFCLNEFDFSYFIAISYLDGHGNLRYFNFSRADSGGGESIGLQRLSEPQKIERKLG
jgi:hypothetical protein